MERFDYIVIGGGSAGIASANRAAEYGAKTLIIEKDEVGGTCVNRGCVPKKGMWYGAHILELLRDYAPDYGIDAPLKNFDFQTLKKHRNEYIDRVHNSYFKGFESRGTHYKKGYAKFVEDHIVEVDGEQFYGEHISVLTGGRPALPEGIPGIDLVDVSDDVFNWDELPESLLIVGAGYIAVEMAGMLREFGVDVTLAVRHETPLRQYEPKITESLMENMKKQGITVLSNHNVTKIEKTEDGTLRTIFKEDDEVVSDRVLYAIGRQPNTENIGLENTSIELTDKGYIKVDDYHNTTADKVYAFGDVIGKVELTPVAIKVGRTLSDHLFNGQDPFYLDYNMVPSIVFAHPPIITMGYTEEAAKVAFEGQKITTYDTNFTSMISGMTSNRENIYMKLVCLGDEEKIIGLHGIGFGADEMLQGFAVAITMGATKKQFDQTIALHPTGAEEFVTMR
ncbi:glutathione-disulfide reductase [Aerococcus urinae]